MSAKVTKNFKALVPLLVKKSYKSLENNLSLGGAKKYKYCFWSQSMILDKHFYKNILFTLFKYFRI